MQAALFCKKSASESLKNSAQNVQKPAILRSKFEKFLEWGHSPLPRSPVGKGHPSLLHPLGACGASIFAPLGLVPPLSPALLFS